MLQNFAVDCRITNEFQANETLELIKLLQCCSNGSLLRDYFLKCASEGLNERTDNTGFNSRLLRV